MRTLDFPVDFYIWQQVPVKHFKHHVNFYHDEYVVIKHGTELHSEWTKGRLVKDR